RICVPDLNDGCCACAEPLDSRAENPSANAKVPRTIVAAVSRTGHVVLGSPATLGTSCGPRRCSLCRALQVSITCCASPLRAWASTQGSSRVQQSERRIAPAHYAQSSGLRESTSDISEAVEEPRSRCRSMTLQGAVGHHGCLRRTQSPGARIASFQCGKRTVRVRRRERH